MQKIRILVLFLVSISLFSQNKPLTLKEANDLYFTARNNFFSLKPRTSVKQTERVLIYALENKQNTLAAKSYNLLGLNFEEFGDIKKAISYYEKGISEAVLAKNDTVLGWLYNNIGGIYAYNDIDIEKSTLYFEKAYHATKKIKDNPDFILATLNIASNLVISLEFEKGKKYLDEVKSIVDASEEVDFKILMYETYAKYYDLYENNFENAEQAYLKSIEEGEKGNNLSVKLNTLEMFRNISLFYEKHSKTEEALKFLKKYSVLQKELIEKNNKEIREGKDKNLQLGLISQRVSRVEKENKDHLKKLKYNQSIFILLILLLTLFIVLMYFLYRNYKKNKKVNKMLKKANIQLYAAKTKTEEVTKLKSQFLSTVSHELRTPLYGVIGLTDIIENEHAELKNSKYIRSLKFSAKYLLTLINDVLNLSKIESGHLELNFEKTNIVQEIETLVHSMEVIANQYHNTINLTVDSSVPKFINTDKTRLSQIIINLVSNSLKFTRKGTVDLLVNRQEDKLIFQIKDTGVGIPKEYLDKIFENFVQVKTNSDEEFQGTGLGLAIVKKFVELFKGEIKIESVENQGTIIEFFIPLIIAETENDFEDENFMQNSNFESIHILVVEDNKINQMVTQKIIENNHLKCTMANDGYHALEILNTQSFDIILMDIHMPGINGFETTQKIKELGITTPIIALTASDKYEIAADISTYKMNDVLLKPFEFKDLKAILIKHIK